MNWKNFATVFSDKSLSVVRNAPEVSHRIHEGKKLRKVTLNLELPVYLEVGITTEDLDEREVKQLILLAMANNL